MTHFQNKAFVLDEKESLIYWDIFLNELSTVAIPSRCWYRWCISVATSPGGGGGVVAPSFSTDCETDLKSGGSDKQRQRSSDRPIP